MNLDEFTPNEKFFILLLAFVATCWGYKKATGIDILKGCVDDENQKRNVHICPVQYHGSFLS